MCRFCRAHTESLWVLSCCRTKKAARVESVITAAISQRPHFRTVHNLEQENSRMELDDTTSSSAVMNEAVTPCHRETLITTEVY